MNEKKQVHGKIGSEKKPKKRKSSKISSVKSTRNQYSTRYKRNSSSKQQDIPDALWAFFKIPLPRAEFKFHPSRKWAIDYAWPDVKVALEIEGGIWTKGRHVRPIGYIKDMIKYNSMALYGWLLLRYPPNNINFEQIRNAIEMRNALI